MTYNPVIKNLPELISKLMDVLENRCDPATFKRKMDTLDFEHDSSDGFEDILDSIRPFIKNLSKLQDNGKIDAESKKKLKDLIQMLREEKPLSDLEKIR